MKSVDIKLREATYGRKSLGVGTKLHRQETGARVSRNAQDLRFTGREQKLLGSADRKQEQKLIGTEQQMKSVTGFGDDNTFHCVRQDKMTKRF